mmetsp:Transcript_17869/g.50644  ORF Transcript_17869/g.50644 Transcript_17869/m.50644 type:complete len:260 (+) Transcript_17869:1000-1779(+)
MLLARPMPRPFLPAWLPCGALAIDVRLGRRFGLDIPPDRRLKLSKDEERFILPRRLLSPLSSLSSSSNNLSPDLPPSTNSFHDGSAAELSPFALPEKELDRFKVLDGRLVTGGRDDDDGIFAEELSSGEFLLIFFFLLFLSFLSSSVLDELLLLLFLPFRFLDDGLLRVALLAVSDAFDELCAVVSVIFFLLDVDAECSSSNLSFDLRRPLIRVAALLLSSWYDDRDRTLLLSSLPPRLRLRLSLLLRRRLFLRPLRTF